MWGWVSAASETGQISFFLRIFLIINATQCYGHFLREPTTLTREDRRMVRSIPVKVPAWQDELRKKAATFGQSETEIQRVEFYLGRIKQIADLKHSQISRKNLSDENIVRIESIFFENLI